MKFPSMLMTSSLDRFRYQNLLAQMMVTAQKRIRESATKNSGFVLSAQRVFNVAIQMIQIQINQKVLHQKHQCAAQQEPVWHAVWTRTPAPQYMTKH